MCVCVTVALGHSRVCVWCYGRLRALPCVCVCVCYGRLRALPCVCVTVALGHSRGCGVTVALGHSRVCVCVCVCVGYSRLSSRLLFLDRSRLGRLLFVVTNWPQQSSSTAGTAAESTVVFSGYVG